MDNERDQEKGEKSAQEATLLETETAGGVNLQFCDEPFDHGNSLVCMPREQGESTESLLVRRLSTPLIVFHDHTAVSGTDRQIKFRKVSTFGFSMGDWEVVP